jgi:hypothetical protein
MRLCHGDCGRCRFSKIYGGTYWTDYGLESDASFECRFREARGSFRTWLRFLKFDLKRWFAS